MVRKEKIGVKKNGMIRGKKDKIRKEDERRDR